MTSPHILGLCSPYLKKLWEMVSLGWRTDPKHKKHIVHRVLNFCLWNWRLFILIAFIFSVSLRWDNFLLYTWLFGMPRVKRTWIRSGEHRDLQLISFLLFCQQKYSKQCKQCIELFPIWTFALFNKKKSVWFSHNGTDDQKMALESVLTYWCVCKKKVKWSRYRPGVAQRVGRGIALLFHDRGTRRGWVVSSRPRLHFTPGKDPVPIGQVAGWALVCMYFLKKQHTTHQT